MFFILMKSLGSHVPIRMCIWRQLILSFSIFLTGRASVLTFVIFCLLVYHFHKLFSFSFYAFHVLKNVFVSPLPHTLPLLKCLWLQFWLNKSGKTFFTIGGKSKSQKKLKPNLRCNKETPWLAWNEENVYQDFWSLFSTRAKASVCSSTLICRGIILPL